MQNFEIAACLAYIPDRKYLPELKRYAAYIIGLSNVDIVSKEKLHKIKENILKGRIEKAAESLSNSDLEEIALIEDCRERLEDYLSAGVTLPIITPIVGLEETIRDIGAMLNATSW